MAVIVTDMEMPVSCNCCDFGQRLDNMRTFCVRKPFEVPTDDTYGKRPDWCPLKEQEEVTPINSLELNNIAVIAAHLFY